MKRAIAKKEIESVLRARFGDAFERRDNRPAETLATGIGELDDLLQGFPRGAITEIHGAASSGRTSLLCSALALATKEEEICALVDGSDSFDIASATEAGIDFSRLLWIRGNGNLARAFKAADMLLHGGGFGLVALNLSDVPGKLARRIISSWWFRFRRAIESTPTALIVITPVASVRSCASMVLKLENETTVWPDTLSLVSENRNGSFTREVSPRLSLVAMPPEQSFNYLPLSPLSHSQFLQRVRIRVNRERPREWPDETSFNICAPALTKFENIR